MDTITANNVGMSNASQEKQNQPKTVQEIVFYIRDQMLKNYEERKQSAWKEDKTEELLALSGYCDCIIELLSIISKLEK